MAGNPPGSYRLVRIAQDSWPVIVCDRSMLPEDFQRSEPNGYVVAVMLLHTLELLWIAPGDLLEFDPCDIASLQESLNATNPLHQAYKELLYLEELDYWKQLLQGKALANELVKEAAKMQDDGDGGVPLGDNAVGGSRKRKRGRRTAPTRQRSGHWSRRRVRTRSGTRGNPVNVDDEDADSLFAGPSEAERNLERGFWQNRDVDAEHDGEPEWGLETNPPDLAMEPITDPTSGVKSEGSEEQMNVTLALMGNSMILLPSAPRFAVQGRYQHSQSRSSRPYYVAVGFERSMRVADWLNVAALALCVFLLVSFAVLPESRSHRHYLSTGLVLSVIMVQ
ncbi:hypothetical protein B0A49_03820, partial [Cryomyces minteri]